MWKNVVIQLLLLCSYVDLCEQCSLEAYTISTSNGEKNFTSVVKCTKEYQSAGCGGEVEDIEEIKYLDLKGDPPNLFLMPYEKQEKENGAGAVVAVQGLNIEWESPMWPIEEGVQFAFVLRTTTEDTKSSCTRVFHLTSLVGTTTETMFQRLWFKYQVSDIPPQSVMNISVRSWPEAEHKSGFKHGYVFSNDGFALPEHPEKPESYEKGEGPALWSPVVSLQSLHAGRIRLGFSLPLKALNFKKYEFTLKQKSNSEKKTIQMATSYQIAESNVTKEKMSGHFIFDRLEPDMYQVVVGPWSGYAPDVTSTTDNDTTSKKALTPEEKRKKKFSDMKYREKTNVCRCWLRSNADDEETTCADSCAATETAWVEYPSPTLGPEEAVRAPPTRYPPITEPTADPNEIKGQSGFVPYNGDESKAQKAKSKNQAWLTRGDASVLAAALATVLFLA